MGWTGEHRGFVVEAYYENNRSVTATQREFRTRFALGRNASVPDRKTILLWISNLPATGSTLKRKSPGRPRAVRTPENVEAVRASIQQSPKRSARKHAMALGISIRSLRRILHADLKLHPYKIMMAQELSDGTQRWAHSPTTQPYLQPMLTPRQPHEIFRNTTSPYRIGYKNGKYK